MTPCARSSHGNSIALYLPAKPLFSFARQVNLWTGRFARQSDNQPLPAPQLNIVPVDQLLCPYDGIGVVGAGEGPIADEVSVDADDVCPVLIHEARLNLIPKPTSNNERRIERTMAFDIYLCNFLRARGLSESGTGLSNMPTIAFLKEQIERAKRFAMGMTSTADRDRFNAMADDYQRQLDAASASSDRESQDAAQSIDTTPTTSEAAPSDVVSSSGDEPTTTSTSGPPESD